MSGVILRRETDRRTGRSACDDKAGLGGLCPQSEARLQPPEVGGGGEDTPQCLQRAGGCTGTLVSVSGLHSGREKLVGLRAAPGRLATGPPGSTKAREERDLVPCILRADRGSRSFLVLQAKPSWAYPPRRADFKPTREGSLAFRLLLTNRMLWEQVSEVGSGDSRQSADW